MLGSAEAVDAWPDVGCPLQSVRDDKGTWQGPADGAVVALQPRMAPREMARVDFTRLR